MREAESSFIGLISLSGFEAMTFHSTALLMDGLQGRNSSIDRRWFQSRLIFFECAISGGPMLKISSSFLGNSSLKLASSSCQRFLRLVSDGSTPSLCICVR